MYFNKDSGTTGCLHWKIKNEPKHRLYTLHKNQLKINYRPKFKMWDYKFPIKEFIFTQIQINPQPKT